MLATSEGARATGLLAGLVHGGRKIAPDRPCAYRHRRQGWPPMRRRLRRGVGTWLGVAALLCQILLPFGVARLAEATDPGAMGQAARHDHHHDPGLAGSLGPDWASGHSHAGDTPAFRVRLDLGYLTPFTVLDRPESPAVA